MLWIIFPNVNDKVTAYEPAALSASLETVVCEVISWFTVVLSPWALTC